MKDLILVVGASGTVGSELVKLLKARGERVRTTTSRAPESPDAVQVNLATGEGVHAAFEGVQKAFLLSPPGYDDQYAILSPLIQEAKRRGLRKVVLMTAMGANAVDTAPMRRAELELENSGLHFNVIRPNWFMQNFNTFWIQGIREQGKIQLPAGDAKTSFIDAKDISAVAAELMTSDKFSDREFDLTGPSGLTHAEVAKEIANSTKKNVTYENIEPSILHAGLLKAGLPKGYTDFLITIFGFLREGYNARTTSSVKEILGREPGDFASYAARTKTAWI